MAGGTRGVEGAIPPKILADSEAKPVPSNHFVIDNDCPPDFRTFLRHWVLHTSKQIWTEGFLTTFGLQGAESFHKENSIWSISKNTCYTRNQALRACSRIRNVEAFWYKTEIKIIYFVPLCLILLIVSDCIVFLNIKNLGSG